MQMAIFREPLPNEYDVALELLTLGDWNHAKTRAGFNTVYHTGLVLTLSDMDRTIIIKLEKRPTVEIHRVQKPDLANLEMMGIPIHGGNVTLFRFLAEPAYFYGGKMFWDYDAKFNNCQDWVVMILKFWRLLTSQIQAFIKQSTIVLLANPLSQFVAHQVSNKAARADILAYGCNGPTCLTTPHYYFQ
jgi:hypothetical protein